MPYDAFISYSHLRDRPLARAIQDGLRAFSKSWEELAGLEVYRDDTHIALGSGLDESVADAYSSRAT